mmetsp:Transcript_21808/g.49333  ORF Transcript_21808/g.49333 Transcript_21808/m.49333 type:complete len:80 (+) Transcript_21808:678-917(+)
MSRWACHGYFKIAPTARSSAAQAKSAEWPEENRVHGRSKVKSHECVTELMDDDCSQEHRAIQDTHKSHKLKPICKSGEC